MTLKAGTVCYIVGARNKELNGRVVTLSGEKAVSARGGVTYEFETPIRFPWCVVAGAERELLRPISDPDQPVDVTSDTDEPVTV